MLLQEDHYVEFKWAFNWDYWISNLRCSYTLVILKHCHKIHVQDICQHLSTFVNIVIKYMFRIFMVLGVQVQDWIPCFFAYQGWHTMTGVCGKENCSYLELEHKRKRFRSGNPSWRHMVKWALPLTGSLHSLVLPFQLRSESFLHRFPIKGTQNECKSLNSVLVEDWFGQ